MKDSERFKLRFGTYRTPTFKFGATVNDLARGSVRIVGLSAAKIPWPLAMNGSRKSPILYGALARAVRREAKQAVAHWFGVTHWKVQQWRRALGVAVVNEGTSKVYSAWNLEPAHVAGRKKAWAKAGDLERRAKIAASRRGKANTRYTQPFLGRRHAKETKHRMSATHKARGTMPPNPRAWTSDEIEAISTLAPAIAAEAIGRSLPAVLAKRHTLKLLDCRRSFFRVKKRWLIRLFCHRNKHGSVPQVSL